jgi:hypothetical protein
MAAFEPTPSHHCLDELEWLGRHGISPIFIPNPWAAHEEEKEEEETAAWRST